MSTSENLQEGRSFSDEEQGTLPKTNISIISPENQWLVQMTFPFGTWNLFSGAMPCYFQGLGIIPAWNPLQTWRPAYLSSDQFFGLNVPQPGKRQTANGDSKRWWFPTTGEKRLFETLFPVFTYISHKKSTQGR